MLRFKNLSWIGFFVAAFVLCSQILAYASSKLLSPIREDLYRGRLEISGDPILNTEREVTFTVDPTIDSPDTTIRILLPFEVEFAEGTETEWHVSLKKGERRQFTTRVRIIGVGEWRIDAYVESIFPNGKESRTYYLIGITIGESIDLVSSKARPDVELTTDQSGYITVRGVWEYRDEGGNWRLVRNANVTLYDEELGGDELVATSTTNDIGEYSFYVENIDGPGEGTRDVYVMIECESDVARVTNDAGTVYSDTTNTIQDVPDGIVDMGTSRVIGDSWQALDYVMDEYAWINTEVAWTRSQVLIRWPNENWPHSHGDTIDLPDKTIASWEHLYHRLISP